MQLYVDLDGVLADFDRGYERAFGIRPSTEKDNVDWGLVRSRPNFYRDLPPMADFLILWSRVVQYDPIILTGVPRSVPDAAPDKRFWVKRWIGPDVIVIPTAYRLKSTNAKPGDVLIDDWERYRDLWEAAGGVWITHTSAIETSQKLKDIGL